MFYAVVTALLVLGQGVSGVGGEDEIAAEHSFMHNVNLTEHKRGKSLRRLLPAQTSIKIPPKMYGGEIRYVK